MGILTVCETLNPKAVRNSELYGWLAKQDWHDGILSTIMRLCLATGIYTAEQKAKWIILDGDVDTAWIESLNSVMDDDKMLTLVSHERIPLTPAMRMIFEISYLDNASPACRHCLY
jgi:dynein heavy chain